MIFSVFGSDLAPVLCASECCFYRPELLTDLDGIAMECDAEIL